MKLESESLGLALEAIKQGTWSVLTMSSESFNGARLSNKPTLTIYEKGRVLDKVQIAIERRSEFLKSNERSIRSDYSGLSIGFKW